MDSSNILHILSVFLFCMWLLALIIRKNTLFILMGIELLLNAVNLSFITFARDLNHITPHLMVLFIITIAAAETAIGLSIIINLYRNFGSINDDQANKLKG